MEDRIQSGMRSSDSCGFAAGIRLHYPLEDWIEALLEEYPSELSSITPEGAGERRRYRADEGMAN